MQSNNVAKSICYKSAASPRAFHKCTTQNGGRCFVDDDVNRVSIAMSYYDSKLMRLRMKFYVELAKKGDLQEAETKYIKLATPCATQPDIWELRINMDKNLFRLYYSENEQRTPEFIALAFENKTVSGNNEEIRDAQNDSIKEAQRRYDAYSTSRWGHVDRRCKFCI